MPNTQTLIASIYAAFNHRDIDAAFAFMSENVIWPKASEGGSVVGKPAIRAYWTRQWSEFNPTVNPLQLHQTAEGKTQVTVHQVVKTLEGELLFDGEVLHTYTISNGFIDRMELGSNPADTESTPSTAFARP